MRTNLLGASTLVVASLIIGTPAFAQNTANGVVSGGYGNLSGGGSDVDVWTGVAAVTIPALQNFSIDANAGFANSDFGSGIETDTWSVGGNAVFRGMNGLFGAGIAYATTDTPVGDIDVTNYGVFGEFWAGQMFTLFGDLGMSSNGSDDFFAHGGAAIYPMPNLMLSAGLGYDDSSPSTTTIDVNLEFMPVETLPIAIFGGYTNISASGPDADGWMIGLKVFLGGNGSLVQRHRNGPAGLTGGTF